MTKKIREKKNERKKIGRKEKRKKKNMATAR